MKAIHTTQPGPEAHNSVSILPLYVTVFSLLTAVTFTGSPGFRLSRRAYEHDL